MEDTTPDGRKVKTKVKLSNREEGGGMGKKGGGDELRKCWGKKNKIKN